MLTHGTSSAITTDPQSARFHTSPMRYPSATKPEDEHHEAACFSDDLVTRRSKSVVDQNTAGFKGSFGISPMRCGRRILNALAVEQEEAGVLRLSTCMLAFLCLTSLCRTSNEEWLRCVSMFVLLLAVVGAIYIL